VYLGKDRTHATDTVTATHATVAELKRNIQNVGNKLYMDNFFSSSDLFDDLHSKKIRCCGTVRLNRSSMQQEFRKAVKLKRGDIRTRVRCKLTAMIWNVNLLNRHHPHPPAEGNFCHDHGNALKPAIRQDYNEHVGYVNKSDRMMNTYSISRRTWKWTKKLFLHLLDLTVLNSYIILIFT